MFSVGFTPESGDPVWPDDALQHFTLNAMETATEGCTLPGRSWLVNPAELGPVTLAGTYPRHQLVTLAGGITQAGGYHGCPRCQVRTAEALPTTQRGWSASRDKKRKRKLR